MNTHYRLGATLCPIVLAVLTGCNAGVPPPPPAEPVVVAAPAVTQEVPPPAPAPPVTAVKVAPDILATCVIQDAPSGKSPLFAFDSSALSGDDQRLLDQVAACFTTGPLAGRNLALTGRADPRGTEAYNQDLGDRRASRVSGYLQNHGMTAANLSETSRGARDATGSDEAGWMMDRRVDVDLVAVPDPVASNP